MSEPKSRFKAIAERGAPPAKTREHQMTRIFVSNAGPSVGSEMWSAETLGSVFALHGVIVQGGVSSPFGGFPQQASEQASTIAIELSGEIAELNRVIMEQSAEIRELKELVKDRNDTPRPILVPITTFAPHPFEVLKTIIAVVEPVIPDDPTEDCEYVAEYVEAHVGASGDTVQDAVDNLKDRLLSTLELLEKMPKLSKRLEGQLAVLHSVIRRCPDEAKIK
jgi:hypothetical protein